MTIPTTPGEKNASNINRLSFRERALLLGALVLLISVTWYDSFMQPAIAQIRKASTQIEAMEKTVLRLKHLVEEKKINRASTQHHENLGPLAQLEKKNADLDQHLFRAGLAIVDHEALAGIETVLLSGIGDMKLYGIERYKPKPLVEDEKKPKKSNDAEDEIKLYRRPMTISWDSSYPDAWSYLKKIEAAKLPVIWEELHYKTTTAPNGIFTLTISTVSLPR